MKKNIIIIFLLILIGCFENCVYSQVKSKIRIDTTYFKKEGGFSIDTYKNDTLIHRFSYYNDSTKAAEWGFFEGSQGYHKAWHKNGNLAYEGIVIHHVNVGIFTEWNENGQRTCVKDYNEKDSTIFAIYYKYYETGVLKSIKKYKGKATRVEADPSIKDLFIVIECGEDDLTKTGEWVFFSEFGEVINRINYD
ncbi:MAG: hypothetical protein V4643_00095 [Bacteroidota bacterium]